MRWVRLAELHSSAFKAQPSFLTAAVFFLLCSILDAALHLFTRQARHFPFIPPSKWAVNPSSVSSRWVCWVNQAGLFPLLVEVKGPGWAEEQWLQEVCTAREGAPLNVSAASPLICMFEKHWSVFSWDNPTLSQENPPFLRALVSLKPEEKCLKQDKCPKKLQLSESGTN